MLCKSLIFSGFPSLQVSEKKSVWFKMKLHTILCHGKFGNYWKTCNFDLTETKHLKLKHILHESYCLLKVNLHPFCLVQKKSKSSPLKKSPWIQLLFVELYASSSLRFPVAETVTSLLSPSTSSNITFKIFY